MKRLLVAAAGLLLGPVPIAAHAASFDYRGGCHFVTLNDTTPGGPLGGQDAWTGVVYLDVVPIDTDLMAPSGATATVSCELRIDGLSQGVVLGPTTGTGVVVDARQIQFTAQITDVVALCDHVTVGSETIVSCAGPPEGGLVPPPVVDLFDQIIDTAGPVFDLVNGVVGQLEPVVCGELVALAPAVNGLGHPELAHIDPATGDLHLAGAVLQALGVSPYAPNYDVWWDCPPS